MHKRINAVLKPVVGGVAVRFTRVDGAADGAGVQVGGVQGGVVVLGPMELKQGLEHIGLRDVVHHNDDAAEDAEAKDPFPPHDLQGRQAKLADQALLHHHLDGHHNLGDNDEQVTQEWVLEKHTQTHGVTHKQSRNVNTHTHTHTHTTITPLSHLCAVVVRGTHEGSGADNGSSDGHEDHACPVGKPQFALEEHATGQPCEQHHASTQHLERRSVGEAKTEVHDGCGGPVIGVWVTSDWDSRGTQWWLTCHSKQGWRATDG